MEILSFIKNPLIFGVLVGILSLVLLFLKEKLTVKDNDQKSSYSTYVQLFFASFIPSTALAFLLYNRNISFSKTQNKKITISENISQNGGDNSSQELFNDVPIERSAKPIKRSKQIYTDIPNY